MCEPFIFLNNKLRKKNHQLPGNKKGLFWCIQTQNSRQHRVCRKQKLLYINDISVFHKLHTGLISVKNPIVFLSNTIRFSSIINMNSINNHRARQSNNKHYQYFQWRNIGPLPTLSVKSNLQSVD